MRRPHGLRWPRAFKLAARWLGVAVLALILWSAAWTALSAGDRLALHPFWGSGALLLLALVGSRLVHRSWKVPAALVLLAVVVVLATVLAVVGSAKVAR